MLLQGRVLDRHPKEALAALQGGRFRHAASSAAQPFRLEARASPPNVLHSLGLQATQAAAVMALPVPAGSPDNHVADDGRLVGFPQATRRQATCKGPSCLHIDADSILQALPPFGNPCKVAGLKALVQAAISRMLPPPRRPTGDEGGFQAHFLQQPPEAEQGPIRRGAPPDLSKNCIAPLPPDQGAALPRKATLTGSANLQGKARCMYSLTWAKREPR